MSEVTRFPNGIPQTATEGIAHLGCLEYCLNSNLPETADTEVSVGYQLFCDDGTPITEEECVRPNNSTNTFCVDFTNDVAPLMNPFIPNCRTMNIVQAVGSTKVIYLEHWDIIFNKTTCKTTTSSRVQTIPITVLNYYRQFYEEVDLTIPQFITTRPTKYTICKDQCDFLYFWNPTSTDLEVNTISTNGGSNTHILPSGLHRIPVGATNFVDGALSVGDTGNVQFILGALRQAFLFKVESCCCPSPDMNDLIFMESTGAFAGKRLCLESQRIVTSNSEIYKIQNWDSGTDRNTTGGKDLTESEHFEELTWNDKIELTKENERWIKNFFACPVKYMRWIDYTGFDTLVKILMPSGNYEINRENEMIEITITGYIFKKYEAPCC